VGEATTDGNTLPTLSQLDDQRERKAPTLTVKSARGKPFNVRTNPMHRLLAMNLALRCGARTRSGELCQSPAVTGKRRCRMHGGVPGSGAPSGNKNALRHGHYTAEAIARRRELAELIRMARASVAEVEERR
jgi:hypothetical protein